MNKKFLLPGWNDLSPNKKKLISEWVESVLYAQAVSKALIEVCTCDDVTDNSIGVINKEIEKQKFQIVESKNDSEELMTLAELPDILPPLVEEVLCVISCERIRDSVQKEKCRSKCKKS